MFENPETEEERIRRARFAGRHGCKKRGDETRERLRRSRVIARTGVQCGGETFVMRAAIVVMQPLVQLRRSGEHEREHEAREHRADQREAELSCMAGGLEHRGGAEISRGCED